MDRVFDIKEDNNVANIRIAGVIGMPKWMSNYTDEEQKNATKKELREELNKILNIKSKTINIEVDSLGGSVLHATSMVANLATVKSQLGAKINVSYTGNSASAGTHFGFIADTIEQPENLMILVHEARGVARGTADEVEASLDSLRKIDTEKIKGYIAQSKRAGRNKTEEDFKELMSKGKGNGSWLNADESFDYGLITKKTPVYDAVDSLYNIEDKETLDKFNLPELPKIDNSHKTKTMGFFNKKLNSLKAGDVTAAYEGKLSKGTELSVLDGAELKNGTYEIEGHSVEITDNKVTNYNKIEEQTEAVNLADFKDEFKTVQDTVKNIQDSNAENSKATNEAIEKLTGVVSKLADKLNETISEGSPVDVPNAEFTQQTDDKPVDAVTASKNRLKEAEKQRREQKKKDLGI